MYGICSIELNILLNTEIIKVAFINTLYKQVSLAWVKDLLN